MAVKILIVEDDTPLAMMMASLLTRAGCDVQGAHTGEKAMRLAQESKFDLITLDIDLPDMSGFEICRELKQRHLSRHTPIVLISGRLCEEDRQRAGFCFTGFVSYPASKRSLVLIFELGLWWNLAA